MATRRSKRTNSGAADEPAAKRTATEENGIAKSNRDSLLRAQAAMDRLDFKSGFEICREILDSNPFDPTQPLLLRSVCLERNGQVYEAAKDVEKALGGKKTREAHLRATFNFLALALHHLEIAQQLPPQEDEMTTSHLTESELSELKQEIKKSKDRQLKSPFDRLSSELFLKTMSCCSSPSLMMSSSVSKAWSQSIHGSIDLFRKFRMEGRTSSIMKGLKTFGEKSNNSITSIDLEIKEEANALEKEQLRSSILPSSRSLQSLSIAHRKDLCPFIVELASQCPSLTVLSSTEYVAKNPDNLSFPGPDFRKIWFLPSWKPKLRELVWNGGRESLVCDDAMVDRLQEATDVIISSQGIGSSFIVKLLSSNSSLVELAVPWMDKDKVEGLESISFDLPHLKYLHLEQIPPSTENAKCSSFFKNFKAPNLRELYLESLIPKDLSILRSESSPRTLVVESLLVEPTEEAATSLIEAMKAWGPLRDIKLLLPLSTPSRFWNHFIRTITILSREAVEGGYQNHFLFPKLEEITLGKPQDDEDSEKDETDEGGKEEKDKVEGSPVSATALASMVSSRMAVHRRLSHRDVLFASAGNFEASLSTPSGQDVAFASLQTSFIHYLDVNLQLTSEEKAISWLEDNIFEFHNDYNPQDENPGR